MDVVRQHVLEFSPREIELIFRDVQLGQLHFGARIGMVLRDVLPIENGIVRFAQGAKRAVYFQGLKTFMAVPA